LLFLRTSMKKATDILLILILGCLTIISCEDDTIEIEGLSPKIEAKFINNDSLVKVNAAISIINDELAIISDSIDYLDSVILAGDPTDYSENFQSLNTMESQLDSEKSDLQAIRSTINAGEVYVQRIAGTGGSGEVVFDIGDSNRVFNLPLNINANNSEFLIYIQNNQYSIAFSYERDTLVRESRIFIEASDIKLVDFTALDSVDFPCDTLNCKSFEASATLYF